MIGSKDENDRPDDTASGRETGHQPIRSMNRSSTEPGRPRSFRLSRSPGRSGGVFLGAGFFWFVLAGFIAVPFRELWPFIMISIPFLLVGLIRSGSKYQTALAVILLVLSGAVCLLSFTSG